MASRKKHIRLPLALLIIAIAAALALLRRPPGPASDRIAYIYTTSGSAGVYTIAADGSGRARVAVSSTAPDWFDGLLGRFTPAQQGQLRPLFYADLLTGPAWLGNTGEIGFQSRQVGDSCEWLETVASDSGNRRRIACLPFNIREEAFAWSPDGRRFAYAAPDNGYTSIRVMDANGGGSLNHWVLYEAVWGLSFSPDSSLIAVTVDVDASLRIYSAAGPQAAIALDGHSAVSRPAWSPDGGTIAFFCITGDLYLPRTDICTIGRDGDGFQIVPLDRPFPYIKTDLSWSPAGERLAFVALAASGFNDIFLMDPDGRNLQALTTHPAGDSDPAWSPDGTNLVFTSNRDGNWELYTIRADGTDLARLTTTPGDEISPVWPPAASHP